MPKMMFFAVAVKDSRDIIWDILLNFLLSPFKSSQSPDDLMKFTKKRMTLML